MMDLTAKKMRCHLNNTPDLLVDVGYQDDILATTFISMIDVGTGYAKIDVFKGDQYIGHTGVVIHFEEEKLSDPNDYGKAALPYIQKAVEQLLKMGNADLNDTIADKFVRRYVKPSPGDSFSSREAYVLFIKHAIDLKAYYLDKEEFYKQLNRAMAIEYREVGDDIDYESSACIFEGFELIDQEVSCTGK